MWINTVNHRFSNFCINMCSGLHVTRNVNSRINSTLLVHSTLSLLTKWTAVNQINVCGHSGHLLRTSLTVFVLRLNPFKWLPSLTFGLNLRVRHDCVSPHDFSQSRTLVQLLIITKIKAWY